MQPPLPAPAGENPYAAPRSDTNLAGDPSGRGDLTDEEIVAFVDDNVAYYREAWARPNQTGGFYAGFNLGACIFSSLWLLYRKMWPAFTLLLVAQQLLIVLVAVAAALVLDGSESMAASVFVGFLLTKVGMGFLGNGLYLRRARREIRRARLNSPERVNVPYLRTRGGISNLNVGIGILVNLALGILFR